MSMDSKGHRDMNRKQNPFKRQQNKRNQVMNILWLMQRNKAEIFNNKCITCNNVSENNNSGIHKLM